MPRSKEQFENMRQEKVEIIKSAALDLFATEGYHATSINKIARKANISKGLLYNYFESKEALLLSIIYEGFEGLIQLVDPNQDGVLSEEEMVNFIKSLFDELKASISHWRLYYAVFFQPDVYELIKDQFTEMYTNLTALFTDYFKHHGIEEPEKEALVFGSLIDGIGFNYVMNPTLYPIEDLKEYIIKKFSYIK